MKKILSFLFILIIGTCTCAPALAFENPGQVRVGIYYGSGAKTAIRLESAQGMSFGYYQGREFTSLLNYGTTSVVVRKDSYYTYGLAETSAGAGDAAYGPYHLDHFTSLNAEEARVKANELKNAGIPAYVATIGDQTHVMSGSYLTETAAQQAIPAAYPAQVVQTSSYGMQVVAADTGETLYLFDHSELDLGVRPNFTQPTDEVFTLDGSAQYRGGAGLKRMGGGNIRLANVVDLEQYLYSVISREMSPSWHVEALKAQAVCARNYALNNLGKHESTYGVDLCNTVCCQAYPGISSETENSYAPVDETRGIFLTYEGELAETFYCSSMGAMTEDVKNVWGSSYPYLVSVDNSYEDTQNIPNGVWSKTVTAAELTEIMRSKGYEVGNVTDVQVLETTPAGRVLRLRVSGTAGEQVFERESCRLVFGDIVYSQMYTVTRGGQTTVNVPQIAVSSGTENTALPMDEVYIAGSGGTTQIFQENVLCVVSADGQTEYARSEQTAGGGPDTYTFSGQGWGHAVGMSQYGAKGMAENGYTYDQILTHYFQGTKLTQK